MREYKGVHRARNEDTEYLMQVTPSKSQIPNLYVRLQQSAPEIRMILTRESPTAPILVGYQANAMDTILVGGEASRLCNLSGCVRVARTSCTSIKTCTVVPAFAGS